MSGGKKVFAELDEKIVGTVKNLVMILLWRFVVKEPSYSNARLKNTRCSLKCIISLGSEVTLLVLDNLMKLAARSPWRMGLCLFFIMIGSY